MPAGCGVDDEGVFLSFVCVINLFLLGFVRINGVLFDPSLKTMTKKFGFDISSAFTMGAYQYYQKLYDIKALHDRCSAVKLFASEMANKVADRVVQIFGGRGYMREFTAERFYRELRVDRIWEGTSEIQRLIIARGLINKGLKKL